MQDIYNNSVTTNNPEFIPWKYNWDFRVYNDITIETNGTVFDIQNRHAGRIKNASVSFTQQDGAYFSGNISGNGMVLDLIFILMISVLHLHVRLKPILNLQMQLIGLELLILVMVQLIIF